MAVVIKVPVLVITDAGHALSTTHLNPPEVRLLEFGV
jgi:hypothetical protein